MDLAPPSPGMDNLAEPSTGVPRGPPTYSFPQESIICLEHPCIIKNLDNGIRSLGGQASITRFLNNEDSDKSIGASLRPNDILAKAVPSKQVEVDQILLKVSAPKWTGRKRKRGSNDPFLAEPDTQNAYSKGRPSAPDRKAAFRALRDNPDKYTVTAVGEIKQTHRFRSMPDYQYATSRNTTIMKMKDTIMSGDLEKIKTFKLDGIKGIPEDQDVGPPPYFSIIKQPFNYNFRQNTYVKLVTDETGATTTMNITAPAKHIKHYIEADDEIVPTAPPAELEPEHSLESKMQKWISNLRAEIEKRPLMQRRVYSNIFKGENEVELKRAAGYIGYTFSSGPFKDILIKFGVDPRTDPKYRMYQAVSFQITDQGRSAEDDPGSYMSKRKGKREFYGKKQWVPNSHQFDGTKFYRDGKIWQVCDITDPFLKELLETTELRSECDMTYSGWYGNGTWSLLRVIMKDKIRTISEGKEPNDEMYKTIAKMFPAVVNEENVGTTAPDSSGILQRSNQPGFPVDAQTAILASQVRGMAMAAHRYYLRHHQDRQRNEDRDVEMADADADAAKEQTETDAAKQLEMEEEDEALIEDDVGSEDEEEDDDEGEGNESEEEDKDE